MTENFEIALQLLIVGMLSVFFILGIVTGLARVLIIFVNRFFPKIEDALIKQNKPSEQKNIAVITAVVDSITQGKGVVRSIKKLK